MKADDFRKINDELEIEIKLAFMDGFEEARRQPLYKTAEEAWEEYNNEV